MVTSPITSDHRAKRLKLSALSVLSALAAVRTKRRNCSDRTGTAPEIAGVAALRVSLIQLFEVLKLACLEHVRISKKF
jgi:hypothetical protein